MNSLVASLMGQPKRFDVTDDLLGTKHEADGASGGGEARYAG